jgi:hypothetical protein
VSRCKVFGQLPCYGVCAGRCARVLKQHSTHSFRTTTVVTLRSDNFNRADTTNNIGTASDAGAAYTQVNGVFGIATNQGYESSGNSGHSVASLEASTADVDVRVTINGTITTAGVAARVTDTNNFLLFQYASGTGLRMFKQVATVFTQLGSTVVYTASAGDIFRFTVQGNTLNAYVNGVLKIGPITESAFNTITKHGFYTFNDNAVRFDDLSILAP